MGQDSTFLRARPLPTRRLWITIAVAWAAALAATWIEWPGLAAVLATCGIAAVATLGLKPIREAFVHEQNKLALLLNAAPEGFLEIDSGGRIVFANPQVCTLFGYAQGELLGQPIEILVPPEFRHAHVGRRANFWTSSRSRPMGSGVDISGVRKDGSLIALDISLNRVQTTRGTAIYGMVRDNRARKAFEQQLVEGNRRLTASVATLERHTLELRTLTEMGELLHSGNSETELYGIVAQTLERLFPELSGALYTLADVHSNACMAVGWGAAAAGLPQAIPCEDCWALRRGRPHHNTLPGERPRCMHLQGETALSSQCIPLLGHGELLGVLQLFTADAQQAIELTEPARLQLLQALANQMALSLANLRLRETLREQSIIDPLTGINNRRVLDRYLDEGIGTALQERRDVALLVLDIDHFKAFNDCLGHDCGDIALKEVGALLHRSLRRQDIACRMGGEEFAVILPDTALPEATQVAEHLRELVESLRLQREGRTLARITASIGVAALDVRGDSSAALLRRADRALYRAKAAGRNRVTVGATDDDTGPLPRMSLVPRKA